MPKTVETYRLDELEPETADRAVDRLREYYGKLEKIWTQQDGRELKAFVEKRARELGLGDVEVQYRLFGGLIREPENEKFRHNGISFQGYADIGPFLRAGDPVREVLGKGCHVFFRGDGYPEPGCRLVHGTLDDAERLEHEIRRHLPEVAASIDEHVAGWIRQNRKIRGGSEIMDERLTRLKPQTASQHLSLLNQLILEFVGEEVISVFDWLHNQAAKSADPEFIQEVASKMQAELFEAVRGTALGMIADRMEKAGLSFTSGGRIVD